MTLTSGLPTSGDENRYPEDASAAECTEAEDVVQNNITASSVPLSFHRRCGELVTLSSSTNPSTSSSSSSLPGKGRR